MRIMILEPRVSLYKRYTERVLTDHLKQSGKTEFELQHFTEAADALPVLLAGQVQAALIDWNIGKPLKMQTPEGLLIIKTGADLIKTVRAASVKPNAAKLPVLIGTARHPMGVFNHLNAGAVLAREKHLLGQIAGHLLDIWGQIK